MGPAASVARLEHARPERQPDAHAASRDDPAVGRPRGHGGADVLRPSASLRRAQMERRGWIHDEFDLTAQPSRYVGGDFLLVSHSPDNLERIFSRFAKVDRPPDDIIIPLDRKTARHYQVYWLHGFKGYR